MTSSTDLRISFRSPASQYQSTANVYWQVPQTQFRRSTSGSYPGTRARWPTEQQKFRRGIEEPSETGRTGSSGRGTPCQSQESGSTSSGQRSFSCQGEWSPCTTFQSFIFLFSLFHLLPSILLIPFWCPLSFFFPVPEWTYSEYSLRRQQSTFSSSSSLYNGNVYVCLCKGKRIYVVATTLRTETLNVFIIFVREFSNLLVESGYGNELCKC